MTPHGDSPTRPGRIRKGLTYTTALIVVAGLLNALPASAVAYNPRPEVEDVPSVEGSDLVASAIAQDDAVAEAAVTEPESVDWPEEAVLDVDLAGDRARTFAVQEESPVTVTALTGEEFTDWEVPEHWEEFAPAPEEDEPAPEAEETPEPTTPGTGGEEGPRREPDADSPVRGESGDGDAEPSPSADPSPTRDENRREPLAPDESEPALDPTLEPEPVEAVQVEVLDRETTEEVGVNGLLVHVTRTDDSASLAPVRMDVDYSDFAAAFGGDYASRLHVVELDPCVLDDSCAADDTVAFDSPELLDNDTTEQNLSAVVTAAPAQGALFAMAAAPAGGNGDYGATQLSASSSWNVNAQAGDFSWSYGLNVPPAPSQLAPSLGLSYSSGGVDGRIATSNNQTSWIGDGFAYAPGSIERRYAACSDSGHDTGDLCWNTDNVTLSMSGHSGALIKHDDGSYRLSNDDGTKVERLTGATNGAHEGEYWKVTTPDGTQYFFGRNRLPGWSSGDPETESAQTMPVYAAESGQPCYDSTFADSWCQQAYKWNLDHVVDVHGNVMTFYYNAETNNYGRNLTGTATPYVRAANIARIEYGLRSDDVYATAPARVVFETSERCLPTDSFDCAADKRTSGDAEHWPDVPLDLDCKTGTSCTGRHTPTFWSTKKLDAVTTQIRQDGEYTKVDTWALEHSFPEAGDGTGPTLWLDSIEHTGHVGGTETLPKVTFAGTQLPNRVDATDDDIAPMLRWRITSIYSETGGHLDITYSEPECQPGQTPKPHENTKRCYPVKWTPEGGVELTDWFHKYVVTQINELDLVSDQPAMTTSYDYVGTPAWRYTEADGMVKDKYRTWGDWRGYDRVIIRTGRGEDPITEAEYLYFQGMDGDRLPDGGEREASVTDSRGVEHTDHKELNGTLREVIVRNGPGGEEVSREITTPWLKKTAEVTHSWGSQSAHMIRTEQAISFSRKSDGTWFQTRVDNTINDQGLITQVRNHGDVDVTGDEKCVNTTYVSNTDAWILHLVSRTETLGVDCTATPQRPADVITDERVSYDGGAHGAAPTHGLPTRTEKLDSYADGAPVYQTVSQAAFDEHGNTVSQTDANGGVTTTDYTFTPEGLPSGSTETNSLGHTTTTLVDPTRGVPLAETDANGRTMNMAYDPLGRLTSVWLPDRRRDVDTPTTKFEYHIRQDAPTSIVTHTLNAQGGYTTGYEIFDAFLRPRQTQSPAVDGGRLITDTFHDSLGQVVKSRSSYFNEADPSDTLFVAANDAHIPRQSETVYDGVGRATDALFVAFGEERWRTVTEQHADLIRVTPPEGGVPTTSLHDAHGRLVEARTHHGSTPTGAYDAITYTYDRADRLETVTDPEGNTWTNTYDLRGRLVETDDPLAGTTTMTYDELDQLVTKTDARGETLAYVYDSVGRQIELRDDSTEGALRASWVYDTLAKGHLTSSTRYVDGNAYTDRVVTYDKFYRPITTEVLIPSSEVGLAGRYRFSTQYNLDGTVRGITMPAAGGLGRETVAYSYNDLGLPTHMSGFSDYITGTNYNQLGELRQYILDMDVSGTHATYATRYYDQATGRLQNSTLIPELGVSGSLVNRHYAYDDAGNVLNLRNEPTAAHVQSDVQCFEYDHMRRMTDVWTPDATGESACQAAPSEDALGGASPYWHSYTYDTLGNRTTETRHDAVGDTVRTYTHGDAAGLRPQSLTQVEESGPAGTALETYGYDETGNMTRRTTPSRDQELEWDAEGELASVTEEDGSVTSYVYDADGGRLIRHAPDASTLYLSGMELRLDKTSLIKEATRFYSFAGEGVAVRNNDGTLSWISSDTHGTGQVAVNASTGEETHRYMTVFGQDRMAQGDWPSEKGFVGGTRDESTGLTQVGARAYDASLGRFISVDPIMDVTDHQQMHGYIYANNNPATYNDSSGLRWELHVDGYNQDTGRPRIYSGVKINGKRYWHSHSDGKAYRYSGGRVQTLQLYHVPAYKPNPRHEAYRAEYHAMQDQIEAERKLVKAATALAELVADELGITAGLECFTTGDLGACGETAFNIATMFVGGLAGKIAIKYGLRWGKAAELGRKIADLGGDLIKGIEGFFDAKKKGDNITIPEAPVLRKPSGGGESCNSFVPGTQVVMADGSTKPIEEVETGDEVLATDPETGEQSARTVLATIIGSGSKVLVEITIDPTTERDAPEGETVAEGAVEVDTEDAGIPGPVAAGDVVIATDEHPFWVPELKAWVDAVDLAPGMWLQTSAGTWVQINAIQAWSQPATVHNLTVQGVHTYHVAAGPLDVLSHNSGGECPTYFPDRKLPRSKNGVNLPDPLAEGRPHTQLGIKNGRRGSYPQAREFDENGNVVRDIDFTDHGRPGDHDNPHQHRYTPNKSGGSLNRGGAEPLPPRFIWD